MTTSGHQIGPLADEAGQLLDALTARLQKMKAARADVSGDGVERAAPPPESVAAAGAHTCVGWCPICRGAELLRGDQTEVSERLLDTALLVLGTLRSLVPETPAATAPVTPDQASSAPQPGVERIDIR